MQASLRDFMRISIHALREEGDVCFAHMIFRLLVISIHALREEGDATRETVDDEEDISIHALREEGDVSLRFAVNVKRHFYPRPPRGGRRLPPLRRYCKKTFLSTPSARRATADYQQVIDQMVISIHALREEGDRHF